VFYLIAYYAVTMRYIPSPVKAYYPGRILKKVLGSLENGLRDIKSGPNLCEKLADLAETV